MSKKRFASVWDAIEETPEKAENMKLRSSLTLFVKAGGRPLLEAALMRWSGGPDQATLDILGRV